MGDYRSDFKEAVDDMVLGIPGVTGGTAFGYPAYKFGKKVFCFVVTRGVTMKLPEKRVAELIAENPGEMQVFSPGGNTKWKAWLLISRENADDYHGDRALFDESIAYVGDEK